MYSASHVDSAISDWRLKVHSIGDPLRVCAVSVIDFIDVVSAAKSESEKDWSCGVGRVVEARASGGAS